MALRSARPAVYGGSLGRETRPTPTIFKISPIYGAYTFAALAQGIVMSLKPQPEAP
jgi:hypothetical protein